MSVEIELNRDNYIELFPFKNIEEYKLFYNFGKIQKQGIDYLEYAVDQDYWRLIFNYGNFISIIYEAFIP